MDPSDPPHVATPGGRRAGVDVVLLTVVVLLLVAALVGGFLALQAREERARTATEQRRYSEVLDAARAGAEAFVNIRYDDAQASIDRVADGATGELRDRYTASSEQVIERLRADLSVFEGEVLDVGVVDVDADSATVIAATTGTVTSTETDRQPVRRDLRLRLELVLEDGRWLISDLESVS